MACIHVLVFGIGHPWRPSFSCFSSLSVCLCASLPFSFFLFVVFLSFFSCCSFLLRRVVFLLLFSYLLALHSRLRPASPGFCSPGSCMCVFSVVLQFEASARLARLLLARVVSVCFCCCPSIRGSAHRARLLLAGVVVPTCCLVVPFLFCSVPDRSFSWGCWGRLCFSQWSPRLVRAHRFLAASLGPGEQWRGPHVAPVASVPRGDAGRFRYLWGLGSGR